VDICSLGGSNLRVSTDGLVSVHDLKVRVSGSCGVPSSCQVLLLGEQILHDSQCLAQVLRSGDDPASLTMLLSISEVLQILSESSLCVYTAPADVHKWWEAFNNLENVLNSGRVTEMSAQTRDVLCQCLQTPSKRQARERVIRLLAKFAEKGNEDIIRSVAACVMDESCFVTAAASEALGRIADVDNDHAISALASALPRHSSTSGWGAVLEAVKAAFPKIVTKGNNFAIGAVSANLCGRGWLVIPHAALILGQISDEPATAVLAAAMDPVNRPVCTYLALSTLANSGDDRAAMELRRLRG